MQEYNPKKRLIVYKIMIVAQIALLVCSFYYGPKKEEKTVAKDETNVAKVETNTNVKVPSNTITEPKQGKEYKTVVIGTQTWMAENLNRAIPPTGSSKCYNDNESNCKKYGRLYTWSGAKRACPEGWHLPSDAEWQILIDFAGGDKIAGKILKAKSGWAGSGNGADNFGFTALPGGVGLSNGDFRDSENGGLWWSSTEDDAKKAYRRSMDINSTDVHRSSSDKNLLFSVRCVENSEGDAQQPPPNSIEKVLANLQITGGPQITVRRNGTDGNDDTDGNAIAELEQEAEKWKNSSKSTSHNIASEGRYFLFRKVGRMSSGDYSEDYWNWTATSKIKIGNCPDKSVWKMTSQCGGAGCNGKSKIPPKCQSITPKVITDFNFDYDAL